ncbi:MAG: AtpZ/AtpI family protein [Devosia sp.]
MPKTRETKRPEHDDKPGSVTQDLAARIARAQGERKVRAEQAQVSAAKDMTGMSRGLRLGSEFIAAILVGAGMGYLLDLWLGTGPWIMLVMLLIGFAAGVLNVARSASEMNKAAPPPPGSDLGPGDEDEDDR